VIFAFFAAIDSPSIHTRLFFREKPYPWKSSPDDLAAAEKLINDCGYHRRDEELADAKRAKKSFNPSRTGCQPVPTLVTPSYFSTTYLRHSTAG
jgi:hypothetical protein